MQTRKAIATLTAAEAYVVLHGPKADPARAFKLALTELIGRGYLKTQQTPDARIYVVAKTREPLPRTLKAVWSHLANQAGAQWQGIAMKRLGTVVYEYWGHNAKRYARYDLMAALHEGGYYQEEQYRLLGLIPRTRTTLTPLGQRTRRELERLQQLARGGPQQWAREGIAGVAGFAALAGATIFLFDQQGDLLKALVLQARTPVGAQAAYPYSAYDGTTSDGSDTQPDRPEEQPEVLPGGGGDFGAAPEIDWGEFDTLAGLDWSNFDNLDALDTTFDSFSASFDGGNGDSGGDSGGDGGGDGGGGGGE